MCQHSGVNWGQFLKLPFAFWLTSVNWGQFLKLPFAFWLTSFSGQFFFRVVLH